MAHRQKRIGILTSGGDCAGLNAALRAVTHRAIRGYGWRVFGIRDGSLGLMNRPLDYVEFDLGIASGEMLRMGGTILGTINKGDPFAYPMPDGTTRDRSQEFVDGFRELGLDALIVIGGDGSMRILNKLCKQGGVPMVGIPKTIDNDVAHTDYAIGYVTALTVASEAMDRLAPTAASHHRVMLLEVMGRDVGHIAMAAGIAGGADVILIPEIPYSLEGVAGRLAETQAEGRNHALVVVAEGCKTETGHNVTHVQADGEARYGGIGQYLAARLAKMVQAETRVTVLGHVQRGGQPGPRDRMIASAFGVHAVDLIAQGKLDRMVAWQHGSVVDVPLNEVAGVTRGVDPYGTIAHTARGLGIYIGEMRV
ncbi:ATP-dependent 6-phosphofructokinase [Magnetospirillum moscoviense]|uniref:ATP-dependent 6-phosphofructokinase n=1 Tax=Magnetospirillum moscoviense TaxID=1437059 RepID=A0A178N012_9PROT|nr:ATP-dependent 6-phosphofructokinase [Magnetospirillum moscoviense]OAN68014.1 6-phosphofructokinase [Magnetospirillum moscoviense]